MKIGIIYTLSITCILQLACTNNNNTSTEKYQNNRNNIVDVSDKIIDIKTDMIFGYCNLQIFDSFLIVNEWASNIDKQIHLFNKNTFSYITSAGIRGQGPGELTRSGSISMDNKHKILWVMDDGKELMYKFSMDSIINNPMYKPRESCKLNENSYIFDFAYLNDSIVLSKTLHVINHRSFVEYMAKTNLNTNKTERYGYEHPKLVGTKANASKLKLSKKNNLYINVFDYCDLMTICNLDGSLRCNIYGPDALTNITSGEKLYFDAVDIFKDKYIITPYINDVGEVNNKIKGFEENWPTKFLVFDMDGNYKETIETGHKIVANCVDEANNRIICYFEDRENPLGYFTFNLK